MGRRRGFFAELQHQQRLADQRRRQRERAAAQEHARAVREQERAHREHLKIQRQYERTAAADARRAAAADAQAERDRLRAYETSRRAEVDSLNADLAARADEMDSLLAATLGVDDYVDLAGLRQKVQDLPFDRPDLEVPLPPPVQQPNPPQPIYVEPDAPTGFAATFGGKKRHAAEVAEAQARYQQQYRLWEGQLAECARREESARREHQRREAERVRELQAARARHAEACQERRREVLEANVNLERLMVALQERQAWAVEEYLSIVLANSVYPECFPVTHDFEFDAEERELALRVTLPGPDTLPTEKTFRYVKSKDSVESTPLTAKARRDRYAKAVREVAIRSVHEVFEADRDGIVSTISLTVDATGLDPATGRPVSAVLVELATDRHTFDQLDLAHIETSATLERLRAAVSKNPHDLIPVANARGVRG